MYFFVYKINFLTYNKEMKIIRKPSPMLPMVIQIVVAPPSGHSVKDSVQAGAEHALWQVVFTSSLITRAETIH